MPFDRYEQDADGLYTFTDSASGKTLRALPTPTAVAHAQQIDAAKAPPVAPGELAPVQAVPDPVVSAQGPTRTSDHAFVPNTLPPSAPDAPSQPVAGSSPLVPAGPVVPMQVAPPTPGSALTAPPPQNAPAAAPAAPEAGAPVAPSITRNPAQGTDLGNVAAGLYTQAALQAARGTPGSFVPGGTFPTGRTVQSTPGPDPTATARRELAERRLGNVQSDLAYVDARKNAEIAETQEAERQRAEEHQWKLEQLQERERAKLGEIFGRIDQTSRELADAKVDPNHYINSLSTGEQFMTAIAMAFGTFGKALSGDAGPSAAMVAFDEAIRGDIENQKYAIEKKRGDLNALGQVYAFAREKFGDERMAQQSAYLAGLEIAKAKIQRTVAEADAAMGSETQWVDGEIVAGSPYSMRAKEALARLTAEQAKVQEALSQAANGQVAEQFVTTQDKVVGGTAGNLAKSAELMEKAAKASGDDGRQHVTFTDANGTPQKYKLGKFAEAGEGKQIREDLAKIDSAREQASRLEAYLREHPVGSRTFDKSKVQGMVERLSSAGNVILGQGAKNNDEAKRWDSILTGVFTNGIGAVKDMREWLADQGNRRLDQLDARPVAEGSSVVVPQTLQDVATGKKKPGAGGAAGMPRAAAGPPPSPVVRSSSVAAGPLDRAQAALVGLESAGDKQRPGLIATTRAALESARRAGVLTEGDHRQSLRMLEEGDLVPLRSYLARMSGTVSFRDAPERPAPRAVDPAVAVRMSQMARRYEADMGGGASVTTVTTTTSSGKKGKGASAPKVKASKMPNLMPKGSR